MEGQYINNIKLLRYNGTLYYCHYLASVNELNEHALENMVDCDIVGLKIQNQVNQNGKPIGISFRLKYQLSEEMM